MDLIKSLSDLRGISGFEYRIADKIADYFRPYVDEVKIDNLGNVIALKKCSKKDAPKIMIEAHCDEDVYKRQALGSSASWQNQNSLKTSFLEDSFRPWALSRFTGCLLYTSRNQRRIL